MNSDSLRMMDANFNRLNEGLRVLEDIHRFILNDDVPIYISHVHILSLLD